jgi:hypothetical protein
MTVELAGKRQGGIWQGHGIRSFLTAKDSSILADQGGLQVLKAAGGWFRIHSGGAERIYRPERTVRTMVGPKSEMANNQ